MGPLFEHGFKGGQIEEEVLCLFHDRCGTGDRRARIDQLGWAVGGATGVTVVAVLVFRLTLGAGALDESVR